MSIINDVQLWRKARPIKQSSVVALPQGEEVHIWELEGCPTVGVIEKKAQGTFLDFHIDNRPYGVVKGFFARKASRGEKGGAP